MYEAREKEIDGLKVTVTQWPARKALAIKLKLVKAVGPSLGELASSSKGGATSGILNAEIGTDKLGSAIEKLLSALDETTFMTLVTLLMSGVRVNGVEMSDENAFNVQFTGRLEAFYKIVWFVLEVNFGSFFGEGGIGRLTTAVKNLTQQQPVPQVDSQKKSRTRT